MKRILVPVDFSPTSKKAFRFSVDIVSKSGGTIILYHLFTPGTLATLGTKENVIEYNNHFEENSLKRLQRLKKKVLTDTVQVPVSTVVGRIPVVGNILGFAERNHIDMIVMGTQGASGLKKVTIGSVAAKVIAGAGIPVLLVPEKYILKQVESIVFTTLFHKADSKALPLVFGFANLFNAVVTLVNLSESRHHKNSKYQTDFETYAYYVQRKYNDFRVQFQQIRINSANDALENLHKEIPYDMLAMARRKLRTRDRLFQKSFTKKMAYITSLPLLIVPEE